MGSNALTTCAMKTLPAPNDTTWAPWPPACSAPMGPKVRATNWMSAFGGAQPRRPERQYYRDTGHELQPGDGPGVGPPIERFLVQDVEEGVAAVPTQQIEGERHERGLDGVRGRLRAAGARGDHVFLALRCPLEVLSRRWRIDAQLFAPRIDRCAAVCNSVLCVEHLCNLPESLSAALFAAGTEGINQKVCAQRL